MSSKSTKPKRTFADVMASYPTYDTSAGYGNSRQWKAAWNVRMGKDEYDPILNRQSKNPFQILGIHESATVAEIKSAFRKLAMEWHPDRNPDKPDAEETFKVIAAAYSKLQDRYNF
jgi:DnaJ-domain-containing protein 1